MKKRQKKKKKKQKQKGRERGTASYIKRPGEEEEEMRGVWFCAMRFYKQRKWRGFVLLYVICM